MTNLVQQIAQSYLGVLDSPGNDCYCRSKSVSWPEREPEARPNQPGRSGTDGSDVDGDGDSVSSSIISIGTTAADAAALSR